MKVFLILTVLMALPPTALPQEENPYIPPCRGGEVGYWQFLPRGDRAALLLSTDESANREAVICYVPASAKVTVTMHEGAM